MRTIYPFSDEAMRIIDLPLKSEWYEMIERGEKKEEYREIKPYWTKRFQGRKITHVRFRYGYTSRTMIFAVKSITVGRGLSVWGAPQDEVYIISLGKRIYT